jgi:hypothetical protein
MPSLAKGNNVFRPSQGTYGASSATLARSEPILAPGTAASGVNTLSMDDSHPSGDEFTGNVPGGHTPDSSDSAAHDSGAEDPAIPPPSSPISLPSSLRVCPATTTPTPDLNSFTSISHTSTSTTTTTASTASKRKRSALSASLLSGSKKQRTTVTGAVALNGIKESLDNFNSTMERSLLMQPDRMRSDTSPERRAKAMELIQEQESYLSDDCLVAFIDLFRADTAAADAYVALKREGLRKSWVQKQMKDLGFPALDSDLA